MSALFTNHVIIYEILNLLKSNEKSLRSCLYINRVWCSNTVPLLWKNPFQNQKSDLFITTYISCLNERFHEWTNDEACSILDSKDILIKLPTIFHYEKYLKEVSFKSLNKAVNSWFDRIYGSEDPKKAYLTQKLEL